MSAATDLLSRLVEIPSLSTHEAAASQWLVGRCLNLGYERAYVDEAGNAVGELGDVDAERVVVLLGHIDTVPGDIPVRIEYVDGDDVLYGRGSVDAKGPLATFVMAGAGWETNGRRTSGLRLVVVGAVEEEAATSKGARHIRDRFDGAREPIPAACIIGEPSGWNRITLGYKGRLLVELSSGQPMAHTAGPDAGVATRAVSFWNWLDAYAEEFNRDRDRIFDQLQPSLREVHTATDAEMNDTVLARAGRTSAARFDAPSIRREHRCNGVRSNLACSRRRTLDINPGAESTVRMDGEAGWMTLTLRGYEPAWRSPRDSDWCERSSALFAPAMGVPDSSSRPAPAT